MITIVDYGMGNLFSVVKALNRIGVESNIASSIEEISKADKLLLPGVGHFKQAMKNLQENNFIDILNEKVLFQKIPILGICLGMQLFTKFSEEGNVNGLGWIDANTLKFPESNLKIPHIGWNNININNNRIFTDIDKEKQFYFVHSYYVTCKNQDNVLTKTNYIIDFDSAIYQDNIYGMQFHPEKSHKQGLTLLKNFAELI